MFKYNPIQWLFPYRCCLCGCFTDNSYDLCKPCKEALPWLVDCCYRCGLRLENQQEHTLCERCQEQPPYFDRLCALFSYDPPLRKLITRLKFASQLAYGRVLGELLKEKIPSWYEGLMLPQAILPTPLHAKRLRWRGFNQALELIRPFIKQTKIPLLCRQAKRVKHTKPQSGLDEKSRHLNIRDAFQIRLLNKYQHVAVIDDVVTTGSTVNALSLVLKQQGIEQVDIWCIARA